MNCDSLAGLFIVGIKEKNQSAVHKIHSERMPKLEGGVEGGEGRGTGVCLCPGRILCVCSTLAGIYGVLAVYQALC